MSAKPNKDTAVVTYNDQWAKDHMHMGMSGVDPKDIRPPQILLVQKSSKLKDMKSTDGKIPVPGQFFHTGKFQIMDSFECYVLSATKSKFVNRNKKDEPVEDQYTIVGLMKSDLSIFGMRFTGTSLWALSPLFTATVAQKRPMCNFNVTMETKFIEGKQNDWFVPVPRIGVPETDASVMNEVMLLATQLDKKVETIIEKDDDEPQTSVQTDPDPSTVGTEDVDPDKIPF